MVRVAQRMEAEGIDAIEVSAGHYESGFTFERGEWRGFFSTVTTVGIGKNLPWYHRGCARLLAPVLEWVLGRIAGYTEGFNLGYSKLIKQAVRIPVICVGGFLHRGVMESAIESGACDLVSVARALIADPFLYRHTKEDLLGPQCDFCNACYARGACEPVDCYNHRVRAEKDHMLSTEAF